MSVLNQLLQQVRQHDAQLADDLEREVKALRQRREFGLNFERHIPEVVELARRAVRKGDKVRFVAPRGEQGGAVDDRVWTVTRLVRGGGSALPTQRCRR